MNSTGSTYLFKVITDVLIRCEIEIGKCRGQAYDGASNMSGHLHGLAAQIKEIVPTAIYTHCFAHRLNLCLQDSTRLNPTIRASLDLCSQIAKPCRSSAKRVVISESFMNNFSTSQSVASIKPICLTRWTVNSEALHGIIANYPALLKCFTYVAEVNHNDDYGIVCCRSTSPNESI